MGNCLTSQANLVKIMKTDGTIVEYRSSTKVHQVLSRFKGHGLSSALLVERLLESEFELLGGCIYYLMPLRDQNPKAERKKVTFTEHEENIEGRGSSKKPNLRIKMVISKHDLKEMLESGVMMSMDRIVSTSNIQEEDEEELSSFLHGYGSKAWKPALKSIPELD